MFVPWTLYVQIGDTIVLMTVAAPHTWSKRFNLYMMHLVKVFIDNKIVVITQVA